MKSSENLINSSIKEFSSHDMEELFVGSEVELRGTPTIGIASFVATIPTGYTASAAFKCGKDNKK
ncbi:type 2 lantibiotic (plasmid) [Staphylococcus haemolyticus]|uniref:type 2 lantibiotic n=1 Tax=Staphylococcus haemolyticus TaxID=1283 RepID=UPI001374BC4B|nr:type 2 lantibiotic [Staphylococcus haemolyticus]QUX20063.1 type 2 lantibiotic [Staphylococcus haemolyticus]UCI01045.1 type 2 lantibiotic [Staphylococcus haemolyticus]UCI03254.1 type 2 lantibiotic [Staphylococcus haemolyticus]